MARSKDSPARGWTPKYIESLRSAEKPFELADPNKPGLRLRVLPSGAKVFRWYVRKLNRVVTIGPWTFSETPAHVTLQQAHAWLDRLKEGYAAGEEQLNVVLAHLHAHLNPRQAAQVGPLGFTVSTVAEDFYKRRILPHRKRPLEARKMLDKDILPVIGSLPIAAVTPADCAVVVERVVDRPAPAWAGKVFGLLKQLFKFADGRDLLNGKRSPAARLDPRDLGIVIGMRKRWLTAEEIPLFWAALNAPPVPTEVSRPDPRTGKVQTYLQRLPTLAPATRAALRILLLTGVRSGELLKAKWEHVNLDTATWTVPVENQKLTLKQAVSAKPWEVPLSITVLEQFRELKRLAGSSPWVMASPPREDEEPTHYDEKSLGHAMRKLFQGKNALRLPGGPACPHDLRRTARTHLGKLQIPLHVVERCLNHRFGRIAETYDQNDYLDDRRKALEKWDAHVQRIVAPGKSNVAFLPATGGES